MASAVKPVNNFEPNAGSFRGGRNGGPVPATQAPGGRAGTEAAAFRQFMDSRAKASGKPAAVVRPLKPTPERIGKADRPRKTAAGHYRAPAPIERLKDQGKLDPHPQINLAMYEAANKLQHHFYQGGLRGIAAQDLSRCVGGGDGGACQFPRDEAAMHHRQRFRDATRAMGWYEAFPYRGAGRLVVDVVCFEMPLKDAARLHVPGAHAETNLSNGLDRLKEGLFILAVFWKMC